MKFSVLIVLLSIVLLSASDCSKKKVMTLRGKLEIKAICMNYTISIVGDYNDTSKVVPSWTDENTGKTYKNAFRLGSPCTFPSTINEGDEFDFEIDVSGKEEKCMVCMAYYPTPPKALAIVVNPKK